MSTYAEFIAKQDGIFANGFGAAHEQVGVTQGVEPDTAGTANQSAYLVAWRYPREVAEEIGAVSQDVDSYVPSVTYGPNNLHSTLSDADLQRDRFLNPTTSPEQRRTLDALTASVRDGLQEAGSSLWQQRAMTLGRYLTNGKTVIIAGSPAESTWQINEAVKAASADHGINDGAGLKGAWGGHVTVNRFMDAAEAAGAKPMREYLDTAREIGRVVPIAVEVGYFNTSPEEGFVYTPYERFGHED